MVVIFLISLVINTVTFFGSLHVTIVRGLAVLLLSFSCRVGCVGSLSTIIIIGRLRIVLSVVSLFIFCLL